MNDWKGKHGPLLIAEIGGNHQGDFEYAKRLCQLAIDSNADAVKFQIYTGNTLVSPVENPKRNQHFKKFELTREQHIKLAEMVIRSGARYSASIWDVDMIDWINPYMDFYKIGSGDLTAYPVLEQIVQTKKPIVLSTGLATEKEVVEAVNFIQSLDKRYLDANNLAVLQCTSMYPIPYEEVNLAVIPRLKKLLNLVIGYSDHTTDSEALKYAYAMGAEVLEFHFTDNKNNETFRDHKVSLEKEDVHSLIGDIKIIDRLQGNLTKAPTKSEEESGHALSFRRAVYPTRDIEQGELLSKENLTCLRPNHGVDAREYYTLLGKKATKHLKAFGKISHDTVK